jgi:hypothetical protein
MSVLPTRTTASRRAEIDALLRALARCDREIAVCERGDYGVAPLVLYLWGLADWEWQRALILAEIVEHWEIYE